MDQVFVVKSCIQLKDTTFIKNNWTVPIGIGQHLQCCSENGTIPLCSCPSLKWRNL